jgi:hypothetical protein
MKTQITTQKICKRNINIDDKMLFEIQDIIANYIEYRRPIYENVDDFKKKTQKANFTFDYSKNGKILITRFAESTAKTPEIFEDLFDTETYTLCIPTDDILLPLMEKHFDELNILPLHFRPYAYSDFLYIKKESLLRILAEESKTSKIKDIEQDNALFIAWLKEKTDNFRENLPLNSLYDNENIPNTDLTYKVLSKIFKVNFLQEILDNFDYNDYIDDSFEENFLCYFYADDDETEKFVSTNIEDMIKKAHFIQIGKDRMIDHIENQILALDEDIFGITKNEQLYTSLLEHDWIYSLEQLDEDGLVFDVLDSDSLHNFESFIPKLFTKLKMAKDERHLTSKALILIKALLKTNYDALLILEHKI